MRGDEPLCSFFNDYYSLPFLLHRLMKKEYVKLNDVLYAISWNSHPECQQVYRDLVKIHGIEDYELWGRCPDKYRHLLPSERQ